ncbi:hypothetical protein ACFE04_001031 [Oxalis oulophora]
MASSSFVIFLTLNLLFFTLISAHENIAPNWNQPKCPRDTLKFGVCADLLGSLIGIRLGTPPVTPCCSLLHGLVDLEAAVCLCTALKADILGIIKIDLPISLSLLLNACSKKVPTGYQCA